MIKGNNCILTFALDGTNYDQVYCGKSFSFNTTSEILETTTKGDGQYQDFDYHSLSYTLSIDGLIKYDTYSSFDVLSAQRLFSDIPFKLIFTDDDSSVRRIDGVLIATSTDMGAASGTLADYTHEFRGRGPYTIINFTEPCFTEIIPGVLAVSYTVSAGDAIVSVNTISGDWASFNYTVDGGAAVNVATNPFTISGLAPGILHSVHITPVCVEGAEGIGITKAIAIPV